MVNIGVLVSGGGTNLQAVLDAQDAGRIPHGRVVCVVSSKPDVYALERARRHNIDTAVANRKELGDQAVFESAILETFRRHDVEMVVCAGFLSILSPDFVRQYPDRIINVHPALIPSFCGKGFYGLHVHEAALNYGVKVTGATVFLVNDVVDGGKILLQKAVEVRDGDTPETLQKRVMVEAEQVILPAATELVCQHIDQEKERQHATV